MNKKNLSQSDICNKYILPAIENASWNGISLICREFPLRMDRVVVRAQKTYRGKRIVPRADYALIYKLNIPLAVVEANDTNHARQAEALIDVVA